MAVDDLSKHSKYFNPVWETAPEFRKESDGKDINDITGSQGNLLYEVLTRKGCSLKHVVRETWPDSHKHLHINKKLGIGDLTFLEAATLLGRYADYTKDMGEDSPPEDKKKKVGEKIISGIDGYPLDKLQTQILLEIMSVRKQTLPQLMADYYDIEWLEENGINTFEDINSEIADGIIVKVIGSGINEIKKHFKVVGLGEEFREVIPKRPSVYFTTNKNPNKSVGMGPIEEGSNEYIDIFE